VGSPVRENGVDKGFLLSSAELVSANSVELALEDRRSRASVRRGLGPPSALGGGLPARWVKGAGGPAPGGLVPRPWAGAGKRGLETSLRMGLLRTIAHVFCFGPSIRKLLGNGFESRKGHFLQGKPGRILLPGLPAAEPAVQSGHFRGYCPGQTHTLGRGLSTRRNEDGSLAAREGGSAGSPASGPRPFCSSSSKMDLWSATKAREFSFRPVFGRRRPDRSSGSLVPLHPICGQMGSEPASHRRAGGFAGVL